ncbi:ABC transporter substrate-binding protein [Mangrovicella endophytica]|uniref:ABC transporter substrate-binding protein n=1 Tax=Mangrovicella endophytica TaxID=2066697 RepID=UPI0018E4C746|nr:ABC transporter substrate-binding protein [Mangrovicella endophytica]
MMTMPFVRRMPRVAGLALGATILLVASFIVQRADAAYVEPPVLAAAVAARELPPVDQRIPAEPLVMDMPSTGRQTGDYGGSLRIIEAQARDTRRMVVFGYARLVGYAPDGTIQPDIVKAVDVEEGRRFTFHLRKGHRWSDGAPFTSDDFRYYWEDVVNDKDLGMNGLPRELLVDGEPPQVSFPDALTVRYEWSKPNPYFLPALAQSLPLEIARPAHYLKQFHKRYADPAELKQRVADAGQRNWVALHYKLDQPYKNANIDLPSLQPWVLATPPPADRFIFRRNPYFHRVDTAGHQLPYIDEVAMSIAGTGLIPAKVGAGEADLQANYLTFGNYPFVKAAAEREGYDVRRWRSGKGSRIALYPNLTCADSAWRALLREADFRRALSLAINREDINLAVYYGLARPSNDTVLPGSVLFQPSLATRWATYDPERARALLDGLHLTQRNAEGIRLLPDGRPLTVVVETSGEEGEQQDVLQLVAEDWRRVGIGLVVKTGERDTLSRRLNTGSTVMSIWAGLENGLAHPNDSPAELAPTNSDQHQWPAWGLNAESGGKLGEAPDLPFAQKLLALNEAWRRTLDPAEKASIWRQMLEINAEALPRIGIIADVDQVIAVSKRLHNVPQTGVFNFNPGAYFGMYRPDTFFFAPPGARTAARDGEGALPQ